LALAVLTLCLWPNPCLADESDRLRQDLGPVAPFSLTERSEKKQITLSDLKGKVWVAHFFFTCCAGGCPTTTKSMRDLQDYFAGERDIVLVSISVFPQNDTPEVLRKYAASWGADPEQWLFLTGAEEDIDRLVQNSFKVARSRASEPKPGYEVDHSFFLMVVDRQGQIRGYVDGRDPQEVERLKYRIRALARERYFLPAINASLNATCTLLLIAGYLAIRRHRERLHIFCMLAALAVSAVFLASYLYFHLVVQEGRHTDFPGQGWVRPLYFGVLLSHTTLAIIVAPLALYNAYLGLRDFRQRHVRVARWTFPLWLYVSITGVVVYWMLYHLYPPY
jgi:protein SCO1/2